MPLAIRRVLLRHRRGRGLALDVPVYGQVVGGSSGDFRLNGQIVD